MSSSGTTALFIGPSTANKPGGTFFVRNSLTSGPADAVFAYGNPGDVILVGDFDGNGTDTLGVRRPINPGDDRDCKDFPNQRAAQG